MSSDDTEPALLRVEMYTCALCLASHGSECHTPGCAFWLHDVPTEDTAHALRFRVVDPALNNDGAPDDMYGIGTEVSG